MGDRRELKAARVDSGAIDPRMGSSKASNSEGTMRHLREACIAVWDQLNPSEPGKHYLTIFFATAMALFVVAYLIGQA